MYDVCVLLPTHTSRSKDMGLALLLAMLVLSMPVDLLLIYTAVSNKRIVMRILMCAGKTATGITFPLRKSDACKNPVLMVGNSVSS